MTSHLDWKQHCPGRRNRQRRNRQIAQPSPGTSSHGRAACKRSQQQPVGAAEVLREPPKVLNSDAQGQSSDHHE